jgi:hypothetical protein
MSLIGQRYKKALFFYHVANHILIPFVFACNNLSIDNSSVVYAFTNPAYNTGFKELIRKNFIFLQKIF